LTETQTVYRIPQGKIDDVKSSDYDACLFVNELFLFEGPDVSTIPDRKSRNHSINHTHFLVVDLNLPSETSHNFPKRAPNIHEISLSAGNC
jgi:hypothetical protein